MNMNINISPVNFSANMTQTTQKNLKPLLSRQKKASHIKNVITRCIHKDKKITIKEISKRTKIPENQVITILYRGHFPELKEMFDRVKDDSKQKKPVETYIYGLAKSMTKAASQYCTAPHELFDAENEYAMVLADQMQFLKTNRWSNASLLRLAKRFPEAPAFGDILITSAKNGNNKRAVTDSNKIDKIFDAHALSPELTEELVAAKGENGYYLYHLNDIYKLAEINNIYPELTELAKSDVQNVYYLFSMTDKSGNRRFMPSVINDLYSCLKKFPQITRSLITEYTAVENFSLPAAENSIRILGSKNAAVKSSIESLNDKENKSKYFEKNLRYKYTGDEILYILKHYESDPLMVSELLNCKNYKTNIKYSSSLVISILKSKDKSTNDGLLWRWSPDFYASKPKIFTNKKELNGNLGSLK